MVIHHEKVFGFMALFVVSRGQTGDATTAAAGAAFWPSAHGDGSVMHAGRIPPC